MEIAKRDGHNYNGKHIARPVRRLGRLQLINSPAVLNAFIPLGVKRTNLLTTKINHCAISYTPLAVINFANYSGMMES